MRSHSSEGARPTAPGLAPAAAPHQRSATPQRAPPTSRRQAQGRPPRRPGPVDRPGALPDRGRRRPRRGTRPPRLRPALARLRGRSRHATVAARPRELHPWIPAGELSAALGDLSDLGHVVSRTDGRVDITSRFVSAQKRIAALEETRQNLLRQLAEAVTLTEQESIRRRLEIVEAQLRRPRRTWRRPAARAAGARQRHDRRRPRPRRRRRRRRRGASATPSTTRARSCR